MAYEIGDYIDDDYEDLDDEELLDDDVDLDDPYTEIMGDYLVGARPGRKARRRRRRRRLLARKRAQNATLVKTSGPTKGRELTLGFDSVATVAAAASSNVSSQPQVVFRPTRIVVPAAVAPSFIFTDVRIGKNSQLISADNVPAEAFSNNAFGVQLKMDTAQVSQLITMSVTNISAGAVRFLAAMVGDAVE